MPSLSHEILVELFRNGKELVRELLRACAHLELAEVTAELSAEVTAEIASVDLSQTVSTEYRADQVTLFRRPDRSVARACVVEIQLRPDADKRRSWPEYITAARRRFGCPVLLLVVAPDPAVARWARQPIDTGHPGFTLAPLVISYPDIPRVVEPSLAKHAPELSVLSVLAHPEQDVALTAVSALRHLPPDQLKLYFDIIWQSLPDSVRRTLETHMLHYEYQSDFARRYLAQGREEGREAGREEGREAGRQEGREAGRQEGREAGRQEGREAGRQEGREAGRQEGREAGRQEAQRSAALALARRKVHDLSAKDESLLAALQDEARLTALILGLGLALDSHQARLALQQALGPEAE
ncbi:MAG: hypothetical protein IPI49_00250 [Myxococcales bacterium]|nr:hypothetical protein [Myxococcales bacterium]